MPPPSDEDGNLQLPIDSITSRAVESVSKEPDFATELDEKQIELDQLQAQVENFRQDMGERKKYARHIFILTCTWVFGVYLLLIFQGFGRYGEYAFHLTDSIVLAAIGSTTANIVGVFLIVTRYFFPSSKPKSDKKTKNKKSSKRTPVDSN